MKMIADKGVPVLLHPARSSTQADYAVERDSKYLIWQVFGWPYESTGRGGAAGLQRHHADASRIEDPRSHTPPR